jgi:hypothetical protein
MPKSLHTSSMVSHTKDRKCKKPCESSSSSSCCTEQCVDCCTSQYQRLSEFQKFIVDQQLKTPLTKHVDIIYNVNVTSDLSETLEPTGNLSTPETAVLNRCGVMIPPPNTVDASGNEVVAGAYANDCVTSSTQPVSLVRNTSGQTPSTFAGALFPRNDSDNFNIAACAYYFVNTYASGPYEPGCHNNQVYGWYVDVSTGELQLFTQTDGVPTNATRLCLSSETSENMTSVQKKQLKVLNKLFKLSKTAVKEVNGVTQLDGKIVEVCDCKGDKWLLYVNTASMLNGSPLSSCNSKFAVVATKLC